LAGVAERDLEQRLLTELGRTVAGWSPIAGGAQNRLFRIDTQGGPPLVAKFYHRDRWNRLEREFTVLACLGQIGLARVPRALLRSDEFMYGVYTLESGTSRQASELGLEELRAVAAFAADLHSLAPDDMSCDLSPAVEASFCVADQLRVIDARLNARPDVATGLTLHARVAELIERATDGLSGADRVQALPRSAWRINSADFGPQNLLFTDRGDLTVVDFEAGGWDDPARLVMGFVAHAASEDLTPGAVQLFLSTYSQMRSLSAEEAARFERVGLLLDIEWVAIYASALTAEAIAAKQFAMTDFDRDAYLVGVMDKLQQRLARASDGRGYRFQHS